MFKEMLGFDLGTLQILTEENVSIFLLLVRKEKLKDVNLAQHE